ncbi:MULTISPECIES: hypothetical protein [Mucilaginibacter]|jgi:hypothetical protein|uniref:hypothetical protein n=1 Tax=Mucilaginibacter TaxID=423349 RepID=UPI0008714960|nr:MULTISPECIES: hypothetical protein [Mucilaginibacter]NVM66194.1 hypothetical protein [Mucilaginibacter sp. SG538B]GGB12721.1 hypothetical protein GCM10011500_30820 [Mucilaginibacter rubeus]SCW65397.1 hypothetical protein SAMN03159284_02810 [Mucilaginibacter sp. NFR10]
MNQILSFGAGRNPSLLLSFKTLALIIFFSTFSLVSKAQVDTIISNNAKIACNVKEITPDAVKYSYPGEDLLNSVYKNTIQKIVFKSGRVQTFAEATSYKTINGVMDYDKVAITAVESEVRGLYKLTDVSSKAKGTTVFSSQERVKDRAYHKMKIQAAMFGANIVYLTNQRTEGNKYGGYFQSGSTAETNLTGVGYSNVLPDYEKFKQLIGSKTDFIAVKKYELGASDTDVSLDDIEKPFTLSNVTFDSGIVLVTAQLKGESNNNVFQLASFTDSTFSVAYKHKGTAYNIEIKVK